MQILPKNVNETALRIHWKRVDLAEPLCVATPATAGGSHLKRAASPKPGRAGMKRGWVRAEQDLRQPPVMLRRGLRQGHGGHRLEADARSEQNYVR